MIKLQDIPQAYGYCFETPDSCPKASTCLRAQAAQLLIKSKQAETLFVTCVHPCLVSAHAADGTCELYRPDTVQRYAKGMTRLFDTLPLKAAKSVKQQVIHSFSCERIYYQCRSGERLISPKEQERIARIFRAAGIQEAPQFDGYVETLEW